MGTQRIRTCGATFNAGPDHTCGIVRMCNMYPGHAGDHKYLDEYCTYEGWFSSLHNQWLGRCERKRDHKGGHRMGRGVA